MNSQKFGDSYDIVKRFFIDILREMCYQVFVDPMFTGEWTEPEKKLYYHFLGVEPLPVVGFATSSGKGKTALLLDPDTGISSKRTNRHVAIEKIVGYIEEHEIVFAFDQSFSRKRDVLEQMGEKLNCLQKKGAVGFYYNSHACFLFSAKSRKVLANLNRHLVTAGLPKKRLINQ